MRKLYFTFAAALVAATVSAQSLKRTTVAHNTFLEPATTLQKSAPMASTTPQFTNAKKTNLTPATKQTLAGVKRLAKVDAADSAAALISTQPAGTLHSGYYGITEGYEYTMFGVLSTTIDGKAYDMVVADDGSVYLKNALSTFAPNTWIKGDYTDGDTIAFEFPQKYYMEQDIDDEGNYTDDYVPYYLWRMTYNEDYTSLIPDEESQVIRFVLKNDTLTCIDDYAHAGVFLGLGDINGNWAGYADYACQWTPQTDVATTLPATATVQKYRIDMGSVWDSNDDSRIVDVAFDGNDVYVGGLYAELPNAWVKANISGDKATIDGKTYMGIDPSTNYHVYASPSGKKTLYLEDYDYEYDSVYFNKQLLLNYDAEAKTLRADSGSNLLINAGKNVVYSINEYAAPSLSPWTEVPGAPMDPEITDYMDYDDDYGYGAMQIYMEKLTADGNLLDDNKLYYNIYFDGEPFTFYADEYSNLSEDITDVPMTFSDNYDFMKSGHIRTVYFYVTGFETVGVQEIYKDGDNVYKSNLVTYIVEDGELTLGIKQGVSTGNTEVKGTTYTDLSGRAIAKPAHGLYLKTLHYADGSQKTMKVAK